MALTNPTLIEDLAYKLPTNKRVEWERHAALPRGRAKRPR